MKTRINAAGFLEAETHRQCTNCLQMFKRTETNTMKICRKCNCARVKCLSAEYKMRNRAMGRAKKSGIEFNILKEDILIPTHCPILKVKLVCNNTGLSGGCKTSPSLDRIDPTKGYTKDNIQVISHLANQMKAHANEQELVQFAKWVLENYNEEN